MNDERSTAVSRHNQAGHSNPRISPKARQEMSHMTELERKSAMRQMQRKRMIVAKKLNTSRTMLFGFIPINIGQQKLTPAQQRAQAAAKAQKIAARERRQEMIWAALFAAKRKFALRRRARLAAVEQKRTLQETAVKRSPIVLTSQRREKPVIPNITNAEEQVKMRSMESMAAQSAVPQSEQLLFDDMLFQQFDIPRELVAEEVVNAVFQEQPEQLEEVVPIPVQEAPVTESPAMVMPAVIQETEEIQPQQSEPVIQTLPSVPVVKEKKVKKSQRVASKSASDPNVAKPQSDMRIWVTAITIFCSIILVTLAFLTVRSATAANDFRKLSTQVREKAELMATSEPVETIPVATTKPIEDEATAEDVPEVTEPVVKTILPQYAELVVENPELFGWVRIEDTVLDYPVMLSKEDNQKYLYANFAGKYSFAGTPFAENVCTIDSDNILIYGHNIKDGSMFRSLFKYEKQSYWEKHPTIYFSDLYEEYEYEVLAVFYDRVYKKTDNVFKFYQFIDAENQEEFDYAIAQFKEKSLYDTGVDAQYGDKLITLVTCSYQVENGRFVVVARRK